MQDFFTFFYKIARKLFYFSYKWKLTVDNKAK